MKESFPESEVIAPLPWATQGDQDAQAVGHFQEETTQSFRYEIFQPVWQLLFDGFSGLFRSVFHDSFVHGWSTLTQLFQAVKQLPAQQKANRQAFPLNAYATHSARAGQRISLESTLDLHKVHPQPKGQRESSPLKAIHPLKKQKADKTSPDQIPTNPWLEAVKKQQCILPLPQAKKRTLQANSAATAKKRAAHAKLSELRENGRETNRGLDDIYTRPVGELFEGEPELATLHRAQRTNWKKSRQTEPQTGSLPTSRHASSEHYGLQQPSSPEPWTVPTDPYEPEALFKNSRVHQARVQEEKLESALESFEALQAEVYKTENPKAAQFLADVPLKPPASAKPTLPTADPDYAEFIPGLTETSLTEKPRHQKENAAKPAALKPLTPAVNAAAGTAQRNAANMGDTHRDNRGNPEALREPSGISYSGSLLVAKARAAHIDFKRQMPIYQEMKDELSGTDHMFRNHQILHKSISSLTDNYFKKAAEEEANSENLHFL